MSNLRKVTSTVAILIFSGSSSFSDDLRIYEISRPFALESTVPIEGDGTVFPGGILSNDDVNGDGNDDLLISIGTVPDREPKFKAYAAQPILLIYDPKRRRYNVDESFAAVVPPMNLARQGFVGDLNGDDLADVFIGGLGIDEMDFACGEKSILLIQQQDKSWQLSTDLTEKWAFTSGLVAANFDEDKLPELLVINQSTGNNRNCGGGSGPLKFSYLLDFESEEFVREEVAVSSKDLNQSSENVWAAVAGRNFKTDDLERSGLALAADGEVRIFEANSQGEYKKIASFNPPQSFLEEAAELDCWRQTVDCFTAHSYILATNIDGDVEDELVVAYYGRTNRDLGMHRLQILDKSTEGSWADVTEKTVPIQNSLSETNGWCFKVWHQDFDGDGQRDLFCSSMLLEELDPNQGFFYLRKGEQFMMTSFNELSDRGLAIGQFKKHSRAAYATPVSLNGDSWLVGLTHFDKEGTSRGVLVVSGVKLP